MRRVKQFQLVISWILEREAPKFDMGLRAQTDNGCFSMLEEQVLRERIENMN